MANGCRHSHGRTDNHRGSCRRPGSEIQRSQPARGTDDGSGNPHFHQGCLADPAPNNCQVSQYNILAEAQLSNAYVIDVLVPASELRYELDNQDPATRHCIRVYANSEEVGCDLGSTPKE